MYIVQNTFKESVHCTKYIKGKCTLYEIHLRNVYIVQNTFRESVHCKHLGKVYIVQNTFRERVHCKHLGKIYIVQNTFRESVHCTKYTSGMCTLYTTFRESVHCTTFRESVHLQSSLMNMYMLYFAISAAFRLQNLLWKNKSNLFYGVRALRCTCSTLVNAYVVNLMYCYYVSKVWDKYSEYLLMECACLIKGNFT